jgi:hypothetical protein
MSRPILAAALAACLASAGGPVSAQQAAQQDLRLRGDLCFPMRAGEILRSVAAIGNPRDARARDWQRTLGDQLRIAPGGAAVTLAGWTWPGNAVALAILRPERRGVRVLGVWEDCFGPEGCDMALTDRESGPPTMIVVESRCSVPVDDPRATRRPRTEVRRHVVAIGIHADRVWIAGEVDLEQHPEARVHLEDHGRTLVVALADGDTRLPLDPAPR